MSGQGHVRSRKPPVADAPAAAGVRVAGIGTTSARFAAVRELLQNFRGPSGFAYVVVLGDQASQRGGVAADLGRQIGIPVRIAKHGMAPRADTVYFSPAGKLLGLEHGRFAVREVASAEGSDHPIDHFFSDLAASLRDRAAGIMLADANGDGMRGLAAIAAQGGLALADSVGGPALSPAVAGPEAGTHPTLAVPLQAMPALLLDGHAAHPDTAAVAPELPIELAPVLNLLQSRCGFDPATCDFPTLRARIERRMSVRNVGTPIAFAEMLAADACELIALLGDLLIGLPKFFCDTEFWHSLQADVLAPLVAAKRADEPIRVWMPGISRGEDAYTLALSLIELVEAADKHCFIRIFATSTSEHVLTYGRAGVYPATSTDRVAPVRLTRFFLPADAGKSYRVGSRLHECVLFGQHDLIADPPFSRIDLVVCRELLDVMAKDGRNRCIRALHFALNPSGFLVTGNEDCMQQAGELFARVSAPLAAYRRNQVGVAAATTGTALPERLANAATASTIAAAAPPPHGVSPATVARQLILDHFAPPCVLLNNRQEIQYFSGRTEQYLRQPRGVPTGKLLMMLRDGLRPTLSRMLDDARDAGNIVIDNAHVRRDGKYEPVQLTVLPSGEGNERIYLVVFQDLPHVQPAGSGGELAHRLEEELRVTKDDLRRATRHFEASGEELQISREQVVALSEEMQSANEEVARLKEELQSLSEELATVNQQSQVKEAELAAAGTDFQNLLASTEVATVYLDQRMRLRWFTPAMQNLIRLQPSDIGRPITDFAPALTGVSLLADSGVVLAEKRSVVSELQSVQGQWLQRRTAPFLGPGGKPDGMIITITDITEAKNLAEGYKNLQSQSAALEARREGLTEFERQVLERTQRLRGIAFNSAQAAELEHRRIAHIVHDDLLQQIALLRIKFDSLRTPRDGYVPDYAELLPLLDSCARSARQIVAELSPPGLYEFGLAPAFDWLASEMKKHFGLTVKLRMDGAPFALASGVAAVLFRSVRELLINVAKHARVRSALLELRFGDERTLEIVVSDAGVGFDPERLPDANIGGFGLASVRETLTMMGGTMRVESAPRSGTMVTLQLPLHSEPVAQQKNAAPAKC
ncbi:MAG: PAS domain-containing protein [Rhodocyclaceae bacterium]|nr:PAS domain-containing protein [Rhodocyclaceae bacterium]MBX3667304.1 PAS domain-containing protein [Rhodocyclaceae bacterium]